MKPAHSREMDAEREDGSSNKKAIALLSGGLDSATAMAQAIADGYAPIALSFYYGQRHERELIAARRIAKHFQILEHFIIDVNLGQWGGSSLTDPSQTLPTAGVQENIIPSTYVPGAIPSLLQLPFPSQRLKPLPLFTLVLMLWTIPAILTVVLSISRHTNI